MVERTLMRGTTAQLRPVGESSRRLAKVGARARRDERGTALVEFALVAPILLLLVLGILDFGRALNYYNNLTQLAGQGARAAVVDRSPDGSQVSTDSRCAGSSNSIQCQLVKDYTSTSELRNGITVCIQGATPPNVGDPVTVKASYPFNFLPFIGSSIKVATFTLTATQSERQEASPTYDVGCVSGP